MVAKLLTAASVTRINPDPKRRLEIPDRQQPGLYLVVQPSGRRSFAVRTRVAGKTVKITLGDAEALELGKARDQAKDLIKGARSGSDPRVEKAEAHANTVAAVADEYVTRRLKPRLKDWERVAKRLRRDLVPAYGSRPIASITRTDIIRLLDGMGDRGVKQGRNRTLATIRPFLAWALERGIVETNAAVGIRPPVKEMARDRILDDAEVAAVWMACGSLGFPFGPLIRLMLITGQREGECAGMRWRDVDPDGRVWSLPREQTKADRAHTVPLSELALETLTVVPRMHDGDDAMIFSTTGRTKPSGWSGAKDRLDRLSGVTDWWFHDLRRTAASTMARLGHAPHVVAAVLNHSPGRLMGITAVYNRHRYGDEKRAALDAWARHIRRIIDGTAADVVELRRAGV